MSVGLILYPNENKHNMSVRNRIFYPIPKIELTSTTTSTTLMFPS